jgi:hypothetical protein
MHRKWRLRGRAGTQHVKVIPPHIGMRQSRQLVALLTGGAGCRRYHAALLGCLMQRATEQPGGGANRAAKAGENMPLLARVARSAGPPGRKRRSRLRFPKFGRCMLQIRF